MSDPMAGLKVPVDVCSMCGEAVPVTIPVLYAVLHWRDKHPERFAAELARTRSLEPSAQPTPPAPTSSEAPR